jgi:hypothetical protein
VNPGAIAFDGTNMWVADGQGADVIELSPSGSTVGTFTVGVGPSGIAFDGTNMWVLSGEVTKLSPAGVTLGTFPLNTRGGIAFDGRHMWVAGAAGADAQDNEITEL